MRSISRRRAWAVAATVVSLMIVTLAPTGLAAPGVQEQPPNVFQGDRLDDRNVDNRRGRLAPTVAQHAEAVNVGARAIWNDLGTPAVLAVGDAEPLDSGLSADPATAAAEFVADNLDLLGLEPSGAESLELLTVAPMGEGAAVIM